MVTALARLLTDRPVQGDLGMTGEVTVQGKVVPIGGVKQKLLAAHRAGLKEVILPRCNEPDLDDVPETVRAEIEIHLVSTVAEVLSLALSPASRRTRGCTWWPEARGNRGNVRHEGGRRDRCKGRTLRSWLQQRCR